jgi:PilZ domain
MSQYQERIGSDRRVHQRLDDARASLVELGENNSGIVLNISEGGMAILSAEDMDANGLHNLRFQAPEFEHWIETTADLAWISDSKKQAGIRFKELSETVRTQLRAGISIAKTRSRWSETKQAGTIVENRAEITESTSASVAVPDSAILVVAEPTQVSSELNTNPLVEEIVEDEGSEARWEIDTKEKVASSAAAKQDARAQPLHSADSKPQKPSALATGNFRPSSLTPQQSALAEIRFRNLVVNSGVKQSSADYQGISDSLHIYSYGKWIAVGAIALLASLLAFLVGWILGDPSRTKLGH